MNAGELVGVGKNGEGQDCLRGKDRKGQRKEEQLEKKADLVSKTGG